MPFVVGLASYISLLTSITAASAATLHHYSRDITAQKCPPGFRGAIFNTGITNQGSIDNRWQVLNDHGVSNFIAFSVQPLSKSNIYHNVQVNSQVDSAKIPVAMDPRDLSAATALLNGPNPPEYMELFNEPDFSYDGWTPITCPAEAASVLRDIILDPSRTTKLISPAPAFLDGVWLSEFFGNCTGCLDRVDYIGVHVYNSDVEAAQASVQNIHNMFGKPIWITETAPGSDPSAGCSLNDDQVISWMVSMVTWAVSSGFVEKLFWNNASWGPLFVNNTRRCDSSLTKMDGSPTRLLEAYASLCQ